MTTTSSAWPEPLFLADPKIESSQSRVGMLHYLTDAEHQRRPGLAFRCDCEMTTHAVRAVSQGPHRLQLPTR